MNSKERISKFKEVVNTNSRLYDLCEEAIETAAQDPKTSLKAQAEAAREIRTFTSKIELTEKEKTLLNDMEKATSLSDDKAEANLVWLYNLCHRLGKMAPDKESVKKAKAKKDSAKIKDTKKEHIKDVSIAEKVETPKYFTESEDGKVITQQKVPITVINNSRFRPHLRFLPLIIAFAILVVAIIIIVSMFVAPLPVDVY